MRVNILAKFCTNCGSKLEDDASFCTNCGTKTEHTETIKKTQPSFYDMVNPTMKKDDSDKTKTTPKKNQITKENKNEKNPTIKKENTKIAETKNKKDDKTETKKENDKIDKETPNKDNGIDKNITIKIPNNLGLDKITENIPDNLNINTITDNLPNDLSIDKITDNLPNDLSIGKITDNLPNDLSIDKITENIPENISNNIPNKNEISSNTNQNENNSSSNNNEIATISNRPPSNINDTKKKLKELVGGFLLSDEFIAKFEKEGLNYNEGEQIKNKLKKEVSSGKLDEYGLEKRIDELIKEMKVRKGELDDKLSYVDEIFETEAIQNKITEYKLNERKVNNIKNSIKNDLKNDYFLEKAHIPMKANEQLDSVHKREENIGVCGYDFTCVLYEVRHGIIEESQDVVNGYCFVEKDKLTIKKGSAFLNINKGNKVLRYSKINAIDFDKAGLFQFTNSIVIGISGYPQVILRQTSYEDFELLHDAWMEYNNPSKKEPTVEQIPAPAPISNADELMKYAELYEKGFLTEEEFNEVKKKLLDF